MAKIAVVTLLFPAWSETFVKRTVQALCDRGHIVRVFTGRPPIGPPVKGVEGVSVKHWNVEDVQAFAPDVLYGEMGYPAQIRTIELGRLIGIKYVLRIWSGLDVFALGSSVSSYFSVAEDPYCKGIVVEDRFMAKWVADNLRLPNSICIPNSFDVSKFDVPRKPVSKTVLAVARFVKKKGLLYLVEAVNKLKGYTLSLVGSGPESCRLCTRANPDTIRFLGVKAEAELPALYASASMFVAPCIQMPGGDADGIPTTVLEAMASSCPVIVSDLLSASCYVTHMHNGLLVRPGDVEGIAKAIRYLGDNPDAAEQMGRAGKLFAQQRLDINKNVVKLEAALL